MLHLAHKIVGATVKGTDGEIGALEDFYFEEDRWTVRYLLVDTGKWFSGKRVLISPMSVRNGWGRTGIRLGLTKDQVWNSPEFKDGDPLSHTGESHVLAYYGYPDYWGAASIWGNFDSPAPSSKRRLERRLPARVSIPRRVTCEASRRARATTFMLATVRSVTLTTSSLVKRAGVSAICWSIPATGLAVDRSSCRPRRSNASTRKTVCCMWPSSATPSSRRRRLIRSSLRST